MALRCLLVDDNASFLHEAVALLEREGVTVVGVVSTVDEAVRLAAELEPDVVLTDIMLGGECGFDVARRLAATGSSRPAVVLISTLTEADFGELIARVPAAGFLPKAELSAAAIERLVPPAG